MLNKPKRRTRSLAPWVGAAVWLLAPDAGAQPHAPALVCETYPTMPACAGAVPDCTLCHQSAGEAQRNAFGDQIEAAAWPGNGTVEMQDFTDELLSLIHI